MYNDTKKISQKISLSLTGNFSILFALDTFIFSKFRLTHYFLQTGRFSQQLQRPLELTSKISYILLFKYKESETFRHGLHPPRKSGVSHLDELECSSDRRSRHASLSYKKKLGKCIARQKIPIWRSRRHFLVRGANLRHRHVSDTLAKSS